jgi:hypothetical protein
VSAHLYIVAPEVQKVRRVQVGAAKIFPSGWLHPTALPSAICAMSLNWRRIQSERRRAR